MSLPALSIYRHGRRARALVTLAGEIGLERVPQLCMACERCLRDGMRAIDVGLTPVVFCDCCGLKAFLEAFLRTGAVGGTLCLRCPPPMLAWLIERTGSGFLRVGLSAVSGPVPRPGPAVLLATAPVPLSVAGLAASRRLVLAVPAVSGGVW